MKLKEHSVIPGFGLTMGFTVLYLSLVVLIPLSLLFFKATVLGAGHFWSAISSPRVLASLNLSLMTAFVSALINAVFGLLVAWVLVRYDFPGKKIMDALVDFPFALPTAVAGICLTTLYTPNGIMGKMLAPLGIKAAFTPLGIIIALTFIGLPFVVRTLEPVLQDLDKEIEEAAHSLGANPWQTFYKVIFPILLPPLLTGTAMAFARALGEYGSIVFISGNMPFKTEILPLLIMTKLEQYDYAGATAIASLMLVISFSLLVGIHMLQGWTRRYQEI
ncbi:MAG: sulfate ABC transporter permease subunit CysT [Candidatus Omnitrophica bacterium]|nr:sulfate ABC transporter permease subunit CysT [Candidatus Omnitrophota bacterium]